jgi:hypothetical protein
MLKADNIRCSVWFSYVVKYFNVNAKIVCYVISQKEDYHGLYISNYCLQDE